MTDNPAYPARRVPLPFEPIPYAAVKRVDPPGVMSATDPIYKAAASAAILQNPAYPMRRLPHEKSRADFIVESHIAAKLKLAARIRTISGMIDGPHAADLLRVSTALHLTLHLLHDMHVKGEGGLPE